MKTISPDDASRLTLIATVYYDRASARAFFEQMTFGSPYAKNIGKLLIQPRSRWPSLNRSPRSRFAAELVACAARWPKAVAQRRKIRMTLLKFLRQTESH